MSGARRLALALAYRAWRSSSNSCTSSAFAESAVTSATAEASCSGRGNGSFFSTGAFSSSASRNKPSSTSTSTSTSTTSTPSLPPEYAPFYRDATLPVRRRIKKSRASTVSVNASQLRSSASPGANTTEATAGVTPWMLPWERRQILGDEGANAKQGLRPWEKAYWGLFVTALAFLLYSRVLKPDASADEAARAKAKASDAGHQAREAAKAAAARPLLAGRGCFVLDDEDDPFEGLEPSDVQAFVEGHTGASSDDPFAGLEASEIDELVAKWGSSGAGGAGGAAAG